MGDKEEQMVILLIPVLDRERLKAILFAVIRLLPLRPLHNAVRLILKNIFKENVAFSEHHASCVWQ
jgi:hypothetical protein